MKILFASLHLDVSPRAVPLGPAMLAASLKAAFPGALTVDLLDLYMDQSPAACADILLELNPDCVGLSLFVWNRNHFLETASRLKAKRPGIIILAGGPEVSAARDAIQGHDAIDIAVAGECEETIIPIVTQLLKGHWDGSVSAAPPPKDLSALPSPFLDGTLNPEKYSGMLWELSRGCPFRCDFCYESRGLSGSRRFPLDRIRSELQLFAEKGVDQVFVLDPTFNYKKDVAKEILQLIQTEAPGTYFFFEVRSEFIDMEMAELFASVPCSLQVGMQSASHAVLQNINRSIDTDQFAESILMLHEAGATYGFDLIYGLPGDSFEGFCTSLDFAMSLVPNHVDIFPLAVLPGTRLQETAPSFGLQYQTHSPYLVQSTPSFGAGDMLRAADLAEAVDRFYNKGMAVPWFSIVMEALEMKPSTFFTRFAAWQPGDPERDTVTESPTEFVIDQLQGQGKHDLVSIAGDLISCFRAGEDTGTQTSGRSPDKIMELLEEGITTLGELAILLPDDHPNEAGCAPS